MKKRQVGNKEKWRGKPYRLKILKDMLTSCVDLIWILIQMN